VDGRLPEVRMRLDTFFDVREKEPIAVDHHAWPRGSSDFGGDWLAGFRRKGRAHGERAVHRRPHRLQEYWAASPRCASATTMLQDNGIAATRDRNQPLAEIVFRTRASLPRLAVAGSPPP
jgi:hypothetical protein